MIAVVATNSLRRVIGMSSVGYFYRGRVWGPLGAPFASLKGGEPRQPGDADEQGMRRPAQNRTSAGRGQRLFERVPPALATLRAFR